MPWGWKRTFTIKVPKAFSDTSGSVGFGSAAGTVAGGITGATGIFATTGWAIAAGKALGISAAAGAGAVVGAASVGVVVLGAITYVVVKSWPDRLVTFKEVSGKRIQIEALEKIDTEAPLPKVGVIGISRAGKSTLIKALNFEGFDGRSTDVLAAVPTELRIEGDEGSVRIAFLDGAGADMSQQSKIVFLADYLIIILDHNELETVSKVNGQRLKGHEVLLDEVGRHLMDRSGYNQQNEIKKIHILLNKSDQWGAGNLSKKEFEEWYFPLIKDWQSKPYVQGRFTMKVHSNKSFQNVTELKELIFKELTSAE